MFKCPMCLVESKGPTFGFETCSRECARTTAIVNAMEELGRSIFTAQDNLSGSLQAHAETMRGIR